MSLGMSLGTALSGLRVNQKAIEVASHNVANAHTPGYSRQTLKLQTVAVGGQGGGVAIGSIARAADEFLLKEIRVQTGLLGESAARDRYFGRTQDMFGKLDSEGSLTGRMSKLATRIEALSIDPESATRRLDMVEAAKAFAAEMNGSARQIQALRKEADQEIAAAIGEVNQQLEAIAKLNGDIARDKALGRPVNDLMDARDQAAAKVAELIDVQSYARDSGELVLYTKGGQPLVDRTVQRLDYTPAAGVAVGTVFQEITVAGTPVTGDLRSGKVSALLDMRDRVLPGLQTQLDTLTEKMRDEMNRAHNRGTAVPAPNALTGNRVFGDVASERMTISHPVRIAVVDAGGVIQRHYDLPAGSYSIAELRDAVNAGLGGAATAAASDGKGFSLSAANAQHGIAIVDLAGGGDATIAHTSGGVTRQYSGFSSFLGLNDLFVTGDRRQGGGNEGIAELLAVRQDIAGDPARLSRARLYDDLAKPPTAGKTVGITSGDGRALAGMAAVFDASLSFATTGGLPALTGTLGDFAAQIVSFNATQASDARSELSYQQAVVDDLAFKAGSEIGVNIDEEMANLVAYQNAYAAAARVVSVVSEMLDTLTSLR